MGAPVSLVARQGETPPQRPRVVDILRRHAEGVRQASSLSEEQGSALFLLSACGTAALGGYLEVCDHCGHRRPHYNSCRNRNCPRCQWRRQRDWTAQRIERTLPTPHFQVVFTLPSELRPLALANQKVVYDLLFDASRYTLATLACQRLDARPAITSVLHTWARDLSYHPHIHCMITAGGLRNDDAAWVACRDEYLFPYRLMKAMFRGRLLARLDAAFRRGELDLEGDPVSAGKAFATMKRQLYKKTWVVFVEPAGDRAPEQLLRYLGRYIYRVAIADDRLVEVTDDAVTFRTRGQKTVTLDGVEFGRRFLLHVVPKGLRKVRYYGLLAPCNVRTRLDKARELLQQDRNEPDLPVDAPVDAGAGGEVDQGDEDADPWLCPRCRIGTMRPQPIDHDGLERCDTTLHGWDTILDRRDTS